MRPPLHLARAFAWGALAALLWAPASARAHDCPLDDALSEAAAALLMERGEPDGEALLRAAREAGSDVTSVAALRVSDPDDRAIDRFLARKSRTSDAPLVCGEAQTEGALLLLAAFRAGALEPVPEAPGRFVVRLAPGFREPHVVVRDASGALRRLPVDEEGVVEVPAEVERPATVQLVAVGPSGPRPVAERTLGQRAPPGRSYGDDGGDLGQRVDLLREAHGARELRRNRLLGEVAQAHAERVCRSRRVAHELTPGEDPETRLRRRGISARVVGEAVARARSESEALAAIAESPSHQMTVVDRRFTDGGYGSARRGERTCVVVLLAAWPRMVGGPVSRSGGGGGRR